MNSIFKFVFFPLFGMFLWLISFGGQTASGVNPLTPDAAPYCEYDGINSDMNWVCVGIWAGVNIQQSISNSAEIQITSSCAPRIYGWSKRKITTRWINCTAVDRKTGAVLHASPKVSSGYGIKGWYGPKNESLAVNSFTLKPGQCFDIYVTAVARDDTANGNSDVSSAYIDRGLFNGCAPEQNCDISNVNLNFSEVIPAGRYDGSVISSTTNVVCTTYVTNVKLILGTSSITLSNGTTADITFGAPGSRAVTTELSVPADVNTPVKISATLRGKPTAGKFSGSTTLTLNIL